MWRFKLLWASLSPQLKAEIIAVTIGIIFYIYLLKTGLI